VLLAHTNTTTHPSSQLSWLHQAANDVHGYNVSLDALSQLARLEEEGNYATKAVFDYIYALEKCHGTGSDLIAIFEDDIIFAETWLVSTFKAVTDIRNKFKASDHDWLFLRLFNQERSTGWASMVPGDNHELLIYLIITIPTLAALTTLRIRSSTVRRHLDLTSVTIICVLFIPTVIVLFFQAGKASLIPPRPGVRKEAFGCCSQGMVFPRAQVPRVIAYLSDRHAGQIDLILDDLSVEENLDRYALYPVQLQHIGRRESCRQCVNWLIAYRTEICARNGGCRGTGRVEHGIRVAGGSGRAQGTQDAFASDLWGGLYALMDCDIAEINLHSLPGLLSMQHFRHMMTRRQCCSPTTHAALFHVGDLASHPQPAQ
jgi:GR25 family glycosyltransferase involved in LPS biosynthesis